MQEKVDVVIVGGGVMGCSTAHFLARTNPELDVAVIEKDPTYRFSSTALSVGSIRQQFSAPENIQMSMYGIDFLSNINDHLRVNDDDEVSVDFRSGGYLYLAPDSKSFQVLQENHDVQVNENASVALLSPSELSQRYPWMRLDDVVGGSIGLANEGWFDPYALLKAFKNKAASNKVHFYNDEVVSLSTTVAENDKRNVSTVHLKSGNTLSPKLAVVNAAGCWAGQIAQMVNVPLPIEPRKRCVFVLKTPNISDLENCPLVIDTTGMYFRPEGQFLISGMNPPHGDESSFEWDVDYSLFEDYIWPQLAHRVPSCEALKLESAWAGLYDYNTLDQNAILGSHPSIPNFFMVGGFSGHGIQQSMAVGRAVSELLLEGRFTSLNLNNLAYTRVLENKAFREKNIIG